MPLKTYPVDVAEYLDSEEAIAAYLDIVLEEGDPAEFAKALGTVARARGMTQVARDAGIGRETLYNALSATGNPTLATTFGVMKALGLRLTVAPLQPPERPA